MAHGQDNVYKYLRKAGMETDKQALIFSCKIRQLSYCVTLERLSYPDTSTVIIGSGFWLASKVDVPILEGALL